MEIKDVFVNFNEWCPTCKHSSESEFSFEKCALCMEQPVNANSTKPVNWEAKDK